MIFTETGLKGAFFIDIEKREDHRGFFARTWCRKEFEEHGLTVHPAQANVSFSRHKGTLRGMHYQVAPFEESKLLRCTRGAIYDVIIDLRPDSPTYRKWIGVELTSDNYRMIYVPEKFAHGFQSLEDDSEVVYQVTQFYAPGSERGIRWNDPAFDIRWPMEVQVISDKDRDWPDYAI